MQHLDVERCVPSGARYVFRDHILVFILEEISVSSKISTGAAVEFGNRNTSAIMLPPAWAGIQITGPVAIAAIDLGRKGEDNIGLFRPSTTRWYLDYDNNRGTSR